jgi:hypothetical protein
LAELFLISFIEFGLITTIEIFSCHMSHINKANWELEHRATGADLDSVNYGTFFKGIN